MRVAITSNSFLKYREFYFINYGMLTFDFATIWFKFHKIVLVTQCAYHYLAGENVLPYRERNGKAYSLTIHSGRFDLSMITGDITYVPVGEYFALKATRFQIHVAAIECFRLEKRFFFTHNLPRAQLILLDNIQEFHTTYRADMLPGFTESSQCSLVCAKEKRRLAQTNPKTFPYPHGHKKRINTPARS